MAVAAGVTALALAVLVVRKPSRDAKPAGDDARPALTASGATTRVEGAPVVARRPPLARPDASGPHAQVDAGADVDAVGALHRGLESEDEGARVAAVEAAVSATATETLPELERFKLETDPEVAPSVIHAVALLGASADGNKRDEAASTLSRWLDSERRREGPDALGNVSNLVEALGEVGGKDAVDALVTALDRADMALHLEALAVQQLGELHDPRARGAIERFAARVAKLPPAEGLDEELRVEAIAAARDALAKL